MQDLAALDMPARFEHFEPADIVDRARSPRNRPLDRVLDAGGRGTDELNDLVDVVSHELPSSKLADAPAYASLSEEPTNDGLFPPGRPQSAVSELQRGKADVIAGRLADPEPE